MTSLENGDFETRARRFKARPKTAFRLGPSYPQRSSLNFSHGKPGFSANVKRQYLPEDGLAVAVQDIVVTRQKVGVPGDREEVIGQPVHEDQHVLVDGFFLL